MTTGAVILAAGQSRRFGAQDKLLALVDGVPMATHAMRLAVRPDIAARVVIVSSADIAAYAVACGLSVVSVMPGAPQSASLKAGLRYLKDKRLSRILILLGDMPYVTSTDISMILASPEERPVCAMLNETLMPPALIPNRLIDTLEALEGDRGAGAFLNKQPDLHRVCLSPSHLRDIDFQEDLRVSV